MLKFFVFLTILVYFCNGLPVAPEDTDNSSEIAPACSLHASFGGQIIEAARDQGARIVDGVKYWYQSIKERIFGVNDNPEESALRELPDPLILLTASNATALDSYKNVVDKWDSPLHLNIVEVSIDQKNDWGFRIGNWYFIRKVNPDGTSNTLYDGDLEIKPWMTEPPTIYNKITSATPTEPAISTSSDTINPTTEKDASTNEIPMNNDDVAEVIRPSQ